MAQSSLTGEQLVSLASDFSALAEQAGEMLADPNLNPSVEQTNALYDAQNKLSDIAANLAMWGAKVEFDDSESSFASLSNATQSANAAVKKLKTTVAKINSVVNILGSAASLGLSFATGNAVGVLSAAANLTSAITHA
jgi:hypothetical protein